MNNENAVATIPRMMDVSPEYAEIMMLGNVLFQSGYFKDVRDQAQAVTKILFGRELGFSPIVAMGGIHIIEGKPALSSNLMATLIKRSGKYDYRVKETTGLVCRLMFREKANVPGGWEEVGESIFTMDDAKAAGVVRAGGSWSKFPKAMLFARALSQGLRTYCPDVSASPIYNPEEMGAEVNEEGEVTKLPKSARPLEVTTEDIPIKQPTVAGNNSGGPIRIPSNVPTPGNGSMVQSLPPLDDLVQQAEKSMSPKAKPAKEPKELTPAQRFHRHFREALDPKYAVFADQLLKDWLNANYPEYGGHVSSIPAEELPDRWAQVEKFAKSYQGIA